jgi:hypothetical protein
MVKYAAVVYEGRRARYIGTIGPPCSTVEEAERLIKDARLPMGPSDGRWGRVLPPPPISC